MKSPTASASSGSQRQSSSCPTEVRDADKTYSHLTIKSHINTLLTQLDVKAVSNHRHAMPTDFDSISDDRRCISTHPCKTGFLLIARFFKQKKIVLSLGLPLFRWFPNSHFPVPSQSSYFFLTTAFRNGKTLMFHVFLRCRSLDSCRIASSSFA